MTVNPELGEFKYFALHFNRNGENKTVFTWVDHLRFMTVVSVDR